MNRQTLFEKIWDSHVVHEPPGKPALIYVDLHLVHEVTSPQAFEGLRLSGRSVRRPELTVATVDHNVPTIDRWIIKDEISRKQVEALKQNADDFGIRFYGIESDQQGIVHVIGPELGLTRPGTVIVCGDSHTSTHGAFGAFAVGTGTSEVEHVLATQCLVQKRPKTMEVRVDGALPRGVTAKDVILGIIGSIGVDGAVGHVVEYAGEAIRALSLEGRMTVCNMSIEAGARAGMIAPDETTVSYMEGRPFVPRGRDFKEAAERWKSVASDPGAVYDRVVELDASKIAPQVTWGTNPGMVTDVTGQVPDPGSFRNPVDREAAERALDYMGLEPGTHMTDVPLDRVFIGSCTNSRLEDLRLAARVVEGKHVARTLKQALVVPGSMVVKAQAEKEGLDKIFRVAGFEWRDSGCSMCIGMNADVLPSGERCASTSNRNFEGRQGKGGRTHLVSPMMAAAAAIAGHFVDIREWPLKDSDQ